MAGEVRESYGNDGSDAGLVVGASADEPVELSVDEGDIADADDETESGEYDITATPNDFNIMTLCGFVGSGLVSMPGFQRNFVWDIKRASKLVESIILGLPIPQLFLYEEKRDKYLVIDGQQRLMSVYYFFKGRFPRPESRVALRPLLTGDGKIPEQGLHDNALFQPFKLRLPDKFSGQKNRFSGLSYETLDGDQMRFDMRPLRSVIIRQNSPSDGDSSIYEIFNRLNTGGVNLRPQEIRTCMYHSAFYNMLVDINSEQGWRRLLGASGKDRYMKDVEILLRGFALLANSGNYASSMKSFLNNFSQEGKNHSPEHNKYLSALFRSFLHACAELPKDAFDSPNKRFSVMLYEAVFTAACEKAYAERRMVNDALEGRRVKELARDGEFVDASQRGTTQSVNVQKRLARAREIIGAL